LIKKGEDFVNEGKVKEALGAYTEAQKLAPNLKLLLILGITSVGLVVYMSRY
jgi:cytochrome c-type biogenesis protein CcmH/NrfG